MQTCFWIFAVIHPVLLLAYIVAYCFGASSLAQVLLEGLKYEMLITSVLGFFTVSSWLNKPVYIKR